MEKDTKNRENFANVVEVQPASGKQPEIALKEGAPAGQTSQKTQTESPKSTYVYVGSFGGPL
jgi:hypothetical protein